MQLNAEQLAKLQDAQAVVAHDSGAEVQIVGKDNELLTISIESADSRTRYATGTKLSFGADGSLAAATTPTYAAPAKSGGQGCCSEKVQC